MKLYLSPRVQYVNNDFLHITLLHALQQLQKCGYNLNHAIEVIGATVSAYPVLKEHTRSLASMSANLANQGTTTIRKGSHSALSAANTTSLLLTAAQFVNGAHR